MTVLFIAVSDYSNLLDNCVKNSDSMPLDNHLQPPLVLQGLFLFFAFVVASGWSMAVGEFQDPLINSGQWSIAVCLVALICSAWSFKKGLRHFPELYVVIGLWLSLIALDFFIGEAAAEETGYHRTNMLMHIGILLTFTAALSSRHFYRLAGYACLGGLGLNLLLIVVQALTGISPLESFTGVSSTIASRATGLFGQSNVSAKYLLLTSAVGLLFLPKRLWPVLLGAATVGILMTGSRGNLLLMAILMVFVALVFLSSLSSKLFLWAILFSVIGGLSLLVIVLNIEAITQSLASSGSDVLANTADRLMGLIDRADASSDSRAELAGIAFERMIDNPMGVGFGGFQNFIDTTGFTTHNTYLTQGLVLGFLGLLLFLAFIGIVFLRTSPLGRIVVVLFIGSCFLSGENTQDAFVALLLSILLVSGRGAKPTSWQHQRTSSKRRRRRVPIGPAGSNHEELDDLDALSNEVPADSKRRRGRIPIGPAGSNHQDLDDLDPLSKEVPSGSKRRRGRIPIGPAGSHNQNLDDVDALSNEVPADLVKPDEIAPEGLESTGALNDDLDLDSGESVDSVDIEVPPPPPTAQPRKKRRRRSNKPSSS